MKYEFRCPIEVNHAVDITVNMSKEGVVFVIEKEGINLYLTKEATAQLVDSLQAWLIKGAEMPPVV